MIRPCTVVADGPERIRAAYVERIRREVYAEYAGRLAGARWLRRWRLRLDMSRDIRARLRDVTPPPALYSRR